MCSFYLAFSHSTLYLRDPFFIVAYINPLFLFVGV